MFLKKMFERIHLEADMMKHHFWAHLTSHLQSDWKTLLPSDGWAATARVDPWLKSKEAAQAVLETYNKWHVAETRNFLFHDHRY